MNQRNQKVAFLVCTLGASLIEKLLTDKDSITAEESSIRAGQNFSCCLN